MNTKTLSIQVQQMLHENQAWLEQRTITGGDGTKSYNFSEGDRVEFRNRNNALEAKTKELEAAREVESQVARQEAAHGAMAAPHRNVPFSHRTDIHGEGSVKTAGQFFTDSDEYKAWVGSGASKADFGVDIPDITPQQAAGLALRAAAQNGGAFKTTMTTSAGFAPWSPRIDDVVPYANRRPILADYIPQSNTDYPTVIYMEQTTQTSNAAFIAEGAEKPESALAWTPRSVPIEFVAHLLPITRQQLEDVPGIQSVINQDMVYLLQLEEEDALLNGNGESPQIQGFLNKTGVQTQAKGTDPMPTAIMKAFTKVRWTGFAEPSAVVMHPNDYQELVTLQDATGRYIYGDPGGDSPVQRIWGQPIVVTSAMTENTALTGDFRMYARIWRKGGLRVDISDSHNDTFGKNILTLRVEERLGLVIRRASAFTKITGI